MAVMKKHIIFIASLALLAGFNSCVQMEEPEVETVTPQAGEKIKVILNADRGSSTKSPETRVYVGSIANNRVTYYWNDADQIGVIPLNITDSAPNYVTEEKEILSNKNYATFNAYITSDGYSPSSNPHLLIYYPYSESMLEGNSGTNGAAFAKSGLTFRLPQLQDQYGFNSTLNATDHPSVWAISHYGLAYDLAACSTTANGNDVTSTGDFILDHANTYFQFNVYGTQSEGSENDYGDGTWRLSSVAVEAGHCELGTDDEGNTVYVMSDLVNLAGTYMMTYDYNANKDGFIDDAANPDNPDVELSNVAGLTSVKVSMAGAAKDDNSILGTNTNNGAPAFAVVNGLDIKNNPKGNLNCLKVSVTAYKYEGTNIVGSDTRVRYYRIDNGANAIVGQDISGNYYTIDFEFCDPVESYTDLSLEGTGNCYIVSAPGNYTFNLDVAGNGKLPYGDFSGAIEDPNNLIDNPENYGFTWLWASGLSFEKVDDGTMTDDQVVRQIVNSVDFSGEDGRVSIGLATGSTEELSGNVVLALYKKNADGSAGEIVWTWHLWLSQSVAQHFKFPSSNYNWNFTNEDWHMLDRNLGAESAELSDARSVGLYFQRGRKEPMIGLNSHQGSTNWASNQLPTYRNTTVFGSRAVWQTADYSNFNTFSQPMALISDIPYSGNNAYTYAWNASDAAGDNADDISNDVKSMFDPCPVGYRMPTTREWDNMKADKFRWTIGGQGFGVFGYCVWDGLVEDLSETDDDERIVEYAKHAATDTYTVNGQFERTYYINANSGTGSEIITKFPNTGVLNSDGTWDYIYQGSWTATTPEYTINHAAGPEVSAGITSTGSGVSISAPQISSVSEYSSYATVNFDSRSTYYYSVGSDNPNTTSSFSSITARIYYNSTDDSNSNYISLGLTSNGSKSVYFYTKDANGNVSNYTIVTITRSRNDRNTSYDAEYTEGETKPGTTYTLNITFDDGVGTYYYAYTSSGAKTAINNTNTLSIPCADITTSGGNRTVYLYTMDSNGNYSAATTVRVNYSNNVYTVGAITRGEAYSETFGGETESNSGDATMALWSAGRLDGGSYSQLWFGPTSSTSDGWAEPDENGDWGWGDADNLNNGGTAPFTETRETHLMGVIVYGINEYSRYSDSSVAIPIRCIREYDNASTATIAE